MEAPHEPFVEIGWLTQVIAIILGVWGGIAANIHRYINPHLSPRVKRIALVSDLVVSAFAGLVSYNLSVAAIQWLELKVPAQLYIAVACIGGHMGTRAMVLIVRLIDNRLTSLSDTDHDK